MASAINVALMALLLVGCAFAARNHHRAAHHHHNHRHHKHLALAEGSSVTHLRKGHGIQTLNVSQNATTLVGGNGAKKDKDGDEKEDKEDDKDKDEDDDKDDGKDDDDKDDDKDDEKDDDEEDEKDADDEKDAKKETEKPKVEKPKGPTPAQKDLEKVQAQIDKVVHEVESLSDGAAFEAEVKNDVTMVGNETQSPALADFLGDMWKEMRMFSVPFYKKHLKETLDKLKAKEAKLQAVVDAEKAGNKTEAAEVAPAEKEEKEEKETKEGEDEDSLVPTEVTLPNATAVTDVVPKEKKKKAEAKEGPTPMFTEETMPAVSPTLQCVINLALQYFLVYTSLAILRTVNQFTGGSVFGLQKICETCCTTVTYAPMLSVLFLGTRMRAIQLSQGETEKYKLPQPWVQTAMFICTYAVLLQVILVLVVPIFTGEMNVTCDADGNLDMSNTKVGGLPAMILSAVRYIAMLMLYGGMATVCVGVFMMEGPKEIWGDKPPPVSPAVGCTINLTCQFFAVYLALAIVKTVMQLRGTSPLLEKLEGLLTLAKYTVNFAPMLCILFIGARMRALQMDPKNGNPQKWAQNCMFACTYSVLLQTVLVILMPFVTRCECKRGASEGDVVFELENKTLGIVMTVIRYIALVALYAGFTAVMVSVFIIEHPTDVKLTPPISPAMQCVMNLTVQYFTIYLALFVCITIKQFSPNLAIMDFFIAVFEAGQKTVMFAPMLAMLFIGARMRALQLTKATDGTIPPTAGPQPWAQDGMFLATWSVLVQVIMVLVTPIATGTGKPEMDDDGCVKTPQGANKWVGYALETIRYLCLIDMYGGAMIVVYAVFTMTPETLPPYAPDSNLIPGVDVPNPPTPPTPSF